MDKFLHDLSWVLPLRHPAVTEIANAFTWFGYLPFFLTFLALGFWLWDRERFLRLAILLAVSAVIFAWLKDYWQDPRPDLSFSLDPRVGHSFGRPSGHAMTSVVLWGWLAYEVRRPWMWAIALVMILGVCFSRLYLGVHDVDDVLVGSALGVLTLFIFRWTLGSPMQRFREQPVWEHLLLLAILVPLLWIIWPHNGTPPSYVSGDFFLLAGALLGLSIDRKLGQGPEALPFSAIRVILAALALFILFQLVDALSALGKLLEADKLIWGSLTALLLGVFISLAVPAFLRRLTPIMERAIGRGQ